MPTYAFRNKKTGKEFELIMKYEEKLQYLKDNPNIEAAVTGFTIGDPWNLGRVKPDEGFKDRLRDIKASHHGSTINIPG